MKRTLILLIALLAFTTVRAQDRANASRAISPPRKVQFPTNRAIGRAFAIEWPVNDARIDNKMIELGPAQGEIDIPAGKQLYLGYSNPRPDGKKDEPVDLSPLDGLNPHALYGLSIPFANITPKEVARLN